MAEADLPQLVVDAEERAARLGFGLSCEPPTGPLLATLAAAVPSGGRVLEIGTGCGVGTAWILSGLQGRVDVDVDVVTVERDETLAAAVRAELPGVDVVPGDAGELLPGLGAFDLVFADAEGGKWTGLDLTLAALAPGGVLLVDDMDLVRYERPEHRDAVTAVRTTLVSDPRLVSVEVAAGTGLVLSTRRR